METTPQTPSSGIPSGPQGEIAPEAGAASPEQGSSSGWLTRALRGLSGRNSVPEAEADEQATERGAPPAEPEWSPPAWSTKTEYEQWLQSQQQSFADRRDRAREQRAAAERTRDRDAQIAHLEQEKSEARAQGDTWTVGEKQDEIDALQAGVTREQAQSGALHEFIGALRAETDSVTLDPLLGMLPVKTAQQLIHEASLRAEDGSLIMAPDGQPAGVVTIEQRAALHAAALKAVITQAKAEGRAEARKDPVLRKELMAGFKATPEAEEGEPVVVGDAPQGAGPADMNSFLRSVRGSRGAHA